MEPFFTTKEQGTGLGLATVYGLAQRSNGFVAIHSVAGKGTTVHLYFPKVDAGPTVSREGLAPEHAPLGHGERILIVEDNDKVRDAVAGRLESLGYAVLQARSGLEAIKLLQSGESVALMFSDIVLPGGVTGYDVAGWVRSRKPQIKVVLTSGYSHMPLAANEAVREIRILNKPYTRQQLAHVLREALNS
jgi:CheY-like chemotaxis protein